MSIHCVDPYVKTAFDSALKFFGQVTFTVLDNGGTPFSVQVIRFTKAGRESNTLDAIIRPLKDYDMLAEMKAKTPKPGVTIETDMKHPFADSPVIHISKFTDLYLGSGTYDDFYDKSYSHFAGNTCLFVKRADRDETGPDICVSVASHVYMFSLQPDDSIFNLYSTVGNSAVPYGFIESKEGYYLVGSFNCIQDKVQFVPKKTNNMSRNTNYFLNEVWPALQCYDSRRGAPFGIPETIEAVDLFAKVDRKGLLIRTPVSELKKRRKNAKPTMVLKN